MGESGVVYNAGYVRNLPVSILGTSWDPGMPVEFEVKMDINNIMAIEEVTDRAVTLMLYLMRKQVFLDGNKRTAMLAANHIMVTNGTGIITVKPSQLKDFTKKLVKYYETGDMVEIKEYIFLNCIEGVLF